VLDFSASFNVIGPPPTVGRAISGVDIATYPDRTATSLRRALAGQHDVPERAIVVGNGSTEIIWAIARTFLNQGDTTVIVGPTYGEYEVAARACGARVECVRSAPPLFDPDAGILRHQLARTVPRVVWLCHPNNPTGRPFPVEGLAHLIDASPETLFVVDEAYIALCEGVQSALAFCDGGHVAVVRSMTKDYALAGLRVGYTIAAPSIADAVRRVVPPWSVSALAEAAGLAALHDRDHLEQARAAVASARAHLAAGLHALGLAPCAGAANFVLVPVQDARRVTSALLSRGLAVRDCSSFGLPDSIRIGVRPIPDQERLLSGLAEVLRG
jgi:histidinol-phosphate aminotransferase